MEVRDVAAEVEGGLQTASAVGRSTSLPPSTGTDLCQIDTPSDRARPMRQLPRAGCAGELQQQQRSSVIRHARCIWVGDCPGSEHVRDQR